MNKSNCLFLLLFFVVACNSSVSDDKSKTNQQGNQTTQNESDEPKVTGIGGIFFTSDDPQKTMDWYSKNLGLTMTEYGSVFEYRNANNPDDRNYLIWNPFPKENEYFSPSQASFIINYRVQNLEGCDRFKKNDVTIVDEIEVYDYGKFVHILDPDGNKIELWEPIDSVLTKTGTSTTK
jgi:predicted enzyme related to lactoylglutathione lyase